MTNIKIASYINKHSMNVKDNVSLSILFFLLGAYLDIRGNVNILSDY